MPKIIVRAYPEFRLLSIELFITKTVFEYVVFRI